MANEQFENAAPSSRWEKGMETITIRAAFVVRRIRAMAVDVCGMLARRYSVSGVRVGEPLSSLRSSCSAKCQTRLLDLRADLLAPKADTLAPQFPVYWVQPLRFLRVGARPHLGCWGLIGGTVLDQLGDWPPDLSPHEATGSSLRPHARQRPSGRYTAWPLSGLSRSSRGFRLR